MLRRSLLALVAVSLVAAPALAKPRAKASPLRAGDYVCQAAGAGMFPLSILSGGRYKAAGPAGRYAAHAGLIHFTGGTLANQIGKLVSPTTFELAMDAKSAAYTTCALALAPQ